MLSDVLYIIKGALTGAMDIFIGVFTGTGSLGFLMFFLLVVGFVSWVLFGGRGLKSDKASKTKGGE